MSHEYVLADVKTVNGKDANGAFEAVISAPTLDRDGEVIDERAFEPLPSSIPIHAFHDFHDPVGRAEPFYDDEGTLRARGVFASTARAQEIRQLVQDGVIGHMSVGFMGAARVDKDGVPHITNAELLEASFVSVPSNRQAALTLAKEWAAKAGARNSASDAERLQAIHDLAIENGAKCAAHDSEPAKTIMINAHLLDGAPAFSAAGSAVVAALTGDQKTTVTDPETTPAPVAAVKSPADVSVARARAVLAEAHATLT